MKNCIQGIPKTSFFHHFERSEAIRNIENQWIASGYHPRNDVCSKFIARPYSSSLNGVGILFIMVILNSFTFVIQSQEADTIESDTVRVIAIPDSIEWPEFMPNDTSFITVSPTSTSSTASPAFKPNPKKAILYSAILPGLGQIYNRKYWKLPIVYGGFMGCAYAITWNNKNLQDYGEAYKDLTYDLANYQDDPNSWHQSWQSFVPAGAAASRFNESFRSQLKRGRDAFRRNRDLSIIITVGIYLICMADTYVDAQLFDFDVSPDLSLHIEPVVSPETRYSTRLYGLNCSIKF